MKEKNKIRLGAVLYVLIYGLLLFLIAVLFGSCSVEKQIQRQAKKEAVKDAKALNRVLAKPSLRDSAGRDWAKTHPCEDPQPEVIKGKTDTVTVEDTAKAGILARRIDSILNNLHPANIDSIKSAIREQVLKECTPTHTEHSRVDTLKLRAFRDLQIEKENHARTWKDLQTAINYQIQYLNEAVKAKDKYEEERKAKNLFKWLLYGLVLLLLGLVVYKIWPKPVKRLTDNLKLN